MSSKPDFAYRLSDRVFAGPHPLKVGLPLEEVLGQISGAGVRVVFDLTAAREVPDAAYVQGLAKRGIAHRRLGFENLSTPTVLEMRSILDAIGDATARGATYVHCLYGEGRTGTVAGCFLRDRGDPDWRATLDAARGDAGYGPGSPSGVEQAQFVENWPPRN